MPGQRKRIMSVILGIFALLLGSLAILTIAAVAASIVVDSDPDRNTIFYSRSQQEPRPPGADEPYKGIYESFVEKDGRD